MRSVFGGVQDIPLCVPAASHTRSAAREATPSTSVSEEDDVIVRARTATDSRDLVPHVSAYKKKGRFRMPTIISKDYPTVVHIGGIWCEVWCKFCGTNASESSRQFLTGISGLQIHVRTRHAHDGQDTSTWSVLMTCGRRALSEEDVDRIREGKEPKVAIHEKYEQHTGDERVPMTRNGDGPSAALDKTDDGGTTGTAINGRMGGAARAAKSTGMLSSGLGARKRSLVEVDDVETDGRTEGIVLSDRRRGPARKKLYVAHGHFDLCDDGDDEEYKPG